MTFVPSLVLSEIFLRCTCSRVVERERDFLLPTDVASFCLDFPRSRIGLALG